MLLADTSFFVAYLNPRKDWYIRRPDQSWSFTDCSSFLLMKARKIKDALTTEAGLLALLR
jgi:predicted nucleic acid-binding protein